jgi:predicted RNase H-like HicB family nuclease
MVGAGLYTGRMRYYSVAVVIEKEPEDPGYFAYSPTLPGVFSNGLTIEETRKNMREAVQMHVEHLISRGEAVPEADTMVHVEELTVGLPA